MLGGRYEARIDEAQAKLDAAIDEHVPTAEGRRAVLIAAGNLAAITEQAAAHETADEMRADMLEAMH